MAYRRTEFARDEWYHCYSRGVDKRITFETEADYERFLQALYLCNSTTVIQRSDLYRPAHTDFFSLKRGKPLVSIGAYCLMPNHFHLLLQEISDNGISNFMQKVGTSYTMYFNVKRSRTGNLFVKPFRSKHIDDDRYVKRVTQYIHLNPVELFEAKWKQGIVRDVRALNNRLGSYRYSSLPDYDGVKRPERLILDPGAIDFLDVDRVSTADALIDMTEYYSELDI